MIDINMIIAKNISSALQKSKKRQCDLANEMNYSKQVISNMLSGARTVNAIELKKIASFCNVSMECLVSLPESPMETNIIHVFMGKVKTEEARQGIEYADKLIDMYLFHSRINKNGAKMSERSSL